MTTSRSWTFSRVALIGLVGLVLCPEPGVSQSGTFSPTGSPTVIPGSATATQLLNGVVLVTGTVSFEVARGELYDPVAGTFSPVVSPMIYSRHSPATRLQDGRVLFVGGGLGPYYLGATELYDPGTGLFTESDTGRGRGGPTATLLSSGKVLITGGDGGAGNTNSADLYDPGTGLLTPTGGMNFNRAGHTATLLLSGKVLIAGGYPNSFNDAFNPPPPPCAPGCNTGNTAELYDPVTGLFSIVAGSMTTVRVNHAATLLPSGRVLLVGGFSFDLDTEVSTPLASSEIYDPATGLFTEDGTMSTPRVFPSVTLLQHGGVLIAGGGLSSAELYIPPRRYGVRGVFIPTGSMASAKNASALLPNGKVLFAGGTNTVSEVYDSPVCGEEGDDGHYCEQAH